MISQRVMLNHKKSSIGWCYCIQWISFGVTICYWFKINDADRSKRDENKSRKRKDHCDPAGSWIYISVIQSKSDSSPDCNRKCITTNHPHESHKPMNSVSSTDCITKIYKSTTKKTVTILAGIRIRSRIHMSIHTNLWW